METVEGTLNPLSPGPEDVTVSNPRKSSGRIQPVFWIVSTFLAAFSLLSANPSITLLSLAVPVGLVLLLWKPGEPPIFLFATGFQWLQITASLHYANFYGATLEQESGGPEMEKAIGLALLGLFVIGLGIKVVLRGNWALMSQSAEREALECSANKLFTVYLGAYVLSTLLGLIAFIIAPIQQLLIATMTIKWVLLYMVAYTFMQKEGPQPLLWFAVALEFCTGLLSFFSQYKTVFFLLLVVTLTTRNFWRFRRVIVAVLICAVVLFASIVWSAIKVDYRKFLNQGTGQQKLEAPVAKRLGKLNELVSNLDQRGFERGVDALMARVTYIYYFSMVMRNVPEPIQFENGKLWGEAVRHVIMPRLFFPNKPAIEDSVRTRLYTGLWVSGAEQGTSISLGYMAESFIDFGPVKMFIPLLFMGAAYGLIYRYFAFKSKIKMIGFGIATSLILFTASNFETSNIKLLGGILVACVVMAAALQLGERKIAGIIGLGWVEEPTETPLLPAKVENNGQGASQ